MSRERGKCVHTNKHKLQLKRPKNKHEESYYRYWIGDSQRMIWRKTEAECRRETI